MFKSDWVCNTKVWGQRIARRHLALAPQRSAPRYLSSCALFVALEELTDSRTHLVTRKHICRWQRLSWP